MGDRQTQVVNCTVHQPQIRQLPANLRTVHNVKLASDTLLKILQNEVSRLLKQHYKSIELTRIAPIVTVRLVFCHRKTGRLERLILSDLFSMKPPAMAHSVSSPVNVLHATVAKSSPSPRCASGIILVQDSFNSPFILG